MAHRFNAQCGILFSVEIMQTEHRKLGGNVDAWCGKCKMMLAHTIEAMVGDKPARVHCNTCKSQHSYKASAPSGTTRKARSGQDGEGPTPRQTKTRTSKYQSLLNASSSAAAKTYSPQEKYEPGDVLEHPTFGRGVTTAVKDGTKIEVLFESGSKTLVHGR
jgi:hypothetical protein